MMTSLPFSTDSPPALAAPPLGPTASDASAEWTPSGDDDGARPFGTPSRAEEHLYLLLQRFSFCLNRYAVRRAAPAQPVDAAGPDAAPAAPLDGEPPDAAEPGE